MGSEATFTSHLKYNRELHFESYCCVCHLVPFVIFGPALAKSYSGSLADVNEPSCVSQGCVHEVRICKPDLKLLCMHKVDPGVAVFSRVRSHIKG